MNVPNHIAIILDGNGRWAKKRGMPRGYGHVKGCENLETICEVAKDLGVKYLTVYAFSTENWKRSKEEVDGLMRLFRSYLKKCLKIAKKNDMCVRVIGDYSAFDADIRESIEKLQEFSKAFKTLHFQIALNYGSRDEILRAVNRLVLDEKDGKITGKVPAEMFSSYMATVDFPDLDLMIRTSGALRLTNYLLWQMAYTEFYFTPVPWPDFDREELIRAIEKYNERDRRYGGVKEGEACSKQD